VCCDDLVTLIHRFGDDWRDIDKRLLRLR